MANPQKEQTTEPAITVPKTAPEYLVPPIIAKALIKIQKKLKPIVQKAKNAAYENGYSPLEVIAPMAHELLTEHNIAVVQSPVTDEHGNPALETIFVHYNGAYFARTTRLIFGKADPQAHKGAITYMSRTAMMRMIGITDVGEDDDGNKATGVHAPVTEDQIAEIKTLLKHLKYPPKQIAAEVFNLKTRDAAALAIGNFRNTIAQKVRDDESKKNATNIEINQDQSIEDDSSPHATLQARLTALNLRDKAAENKLVFQLTGRPFLSKVKDETDLQTLDKAIELLETGKKNLAAEFYPPAVEPRIVEENVA